jgi:predicted nucleic acid-binding protein
MIVADTNIIVYLVIRGQRSDAADRLLAEDPHWIAPRLWQSEFRNAVAVLRRAGTLTRSDALGVVAAAESRMLERTFDVESAIVLGCVEESKLSAYDCEFVALARQLQVPLVTADRRIVASFPEIARPLT